MKPTADGPKRKDSAAKSCALPRWKRWGFRCVAILLPPFALLVLTELALRVFGVGYPISFLLSFKKDGRDYFIQNNQFGWRFFGRRMSRVPEPVFIAQTKPPNTIRIFVFGESAAFGDPQPGFGLPRLLQAMLELRLPGTRFEVINAAMTGINSHAILPIIQDCAAADGDIWVLYMGNNEVVGPFGAGTVFGSRAPPLALIRADLALKSLRGAQLLESLFDRKYQDREWGGMSMFLDHQVSAGDPRLSTVYGNFEANLQQIFNLASRHRVGVVASTVAVNLKDCAPFASAHRAGLSPLDLQRWQELWEAGLKARAAGDNESAARFWRDALRLDDRCAKVHFALGALTRDLGQIENAQQECRVACDLDTLRFRCDSRLNDIIRRVAGQSASPRVVLADAEQSFSRSCEDGLPGSELFYDHVHLTFEGNYLLAQIIGRAVEKLVPPELATAAARSRGQAWPSPAACAQRLGWSDFSRREAALEMLRRLSAPPFTEQLDHDAQLKRLKDLVVSLTPAAKPPALAATLRECETASAAHPEDADLALLIASLADALGDGSKALTAADRAAVLCPSSAKAWSCLGLALEKQRQFEKSISAYRQVLHLDSQAFYALNNLGKALIESGRTNDAISAYRQAVTIKPRFGPAWLSLGELLQHSGRNSEAQNCYSNALAFRIRSPVELKRLASFCRDRRWWMGAATNFAEAVHLDPTDVTALLQAGQSFAAAGLTSQAEGCFSDAVRSAPDFAPAHFLYGRALGQRGNAVVAAEQFRAAVRLMPELLEARLNLALALVNSGRTADAIAEYKAVLERWPTNQIALRNLQGLRAAATRDPTP